MDLDELRARVERKRNAAEYAALQNELTGRNREIDPNAVYLSTREICEQAGCSNVVVHEAIHSGELPAIKARGNTRRGVGHSWAVHPNDAKAWIKKYRALRSMFGQFM